MIRGDRILVGRLCRQARHAWRRLPRARRRRSGPRFPWLNRPRSITRLSWLLPAFIFLLVAAPGTPLGMLFALLSLHTLLATLRMSATLASELHEPPRLLIPYLLPVGDAAIFDAQTASFRSARRAICLDWLMLGFGMAFWREHPGWWLAAPLLAVAQAGLAGACALLLARLRPDGRWALLHFALGCGLAGLLVLGKLSPEFGDWCWREGMNWLRRLTPAGLLSNGAHYAVTLNPLAFLWLGAVAVASAGMAWRIERRWRASYCTRFLENMPPATHSWQETARDAFETESDAPEPGASASPLPVAPLPANAGGAVVARENAEVNINQHAADTEAAKPASEAPPRPYGAERPMPAPRPRRPAETGTPHERARLRRELRARIDYDPGEAYASQGPVERVFACLWSARQRQLLPLYGPPSSRWHRRLALALLVVLVTSLVALAGGGMQLALTGAGLGFAVLLPFWEPRWGALWLLMQGPAQSGVHGYLPLALPSLAGAYLSLAYARVLLAGVVLAGALAPWIGAAEALHYGALGCCLGMVWAPLAFLFSISSGTNDSSARWWLTLLIIAIGLVALFVGVSLVVVAFGVEDSRLVAVCAGLAVAGSNALLGAYLWAAGRPWFDLMPRP